MKRNSLWLLYDTYKAKRLGGQAIIQRQRTRLAEIVEYARMNSPYYHILYQSLPDKIEDYSLLPVTKKQQLMQHFDEWVTDHHVKINDIRQFVQDPTSIGSFFLDKYTIATTSGTTGTPGIFLLDNFTMKVTNALAMRMLTTWLDFADLIKIIKKGGRMAMIMAKGGHYASAIAASRLEKKLGKRVLALSAHRPLEELIAPLNAFDPALLAPYASMGALLAMEQQNGHLKINPVLLALSAEGLARSEYERIAKVFKAKVGNSYACTECPFLSYSCKHDWLHVNNDWVIIEPVDVNYCPVPPGEPSHTVLITNLANKVQPIIRYDLGDSIILQPDPCPCGNKLPALRVAGRSSDIVYFINENGENISIPPLAFSILVDQVKGIERIQIVQTTPTNLRVRLIYDPKAEQDHVWQDIKSVITDLLKERKLNHITIERASELPEQSVAGKFREVIPLKQK